MSTFSRKFVIYFAKMRVGVRSKAIRTISKNSVFLIQLARLIHPCFLVCQILEGKSTDITCNMRFAEWEEM